MSLHLDIPDHLLISILKKLDAVAFSRLLRASKWLYDRAAKYRKSIKIHVRHLDYEVTPPSRRRQMVFIYTSDDDKQKILFPKNFSVFLEQTIPDLGFFHFGQIIFSHRHCDWDTELMVEMLTAMKSNGFSCQLLVNEIPIMLEETITSLRPLELATLRPYDIVANVKEPVLKKLRSIECVPCSTENILETISTLTRFCANTTIWAHNIESDELEEQLIPQLTGHLQEKRSKRAGQLNLYISNVKSDLFLEMITKLAERVFKNETQTTVVFLPSETLERLAVILFEDFNQVPYTMLYYKVVGGFEEFKHFYYEIVQEEREEPEFWADVNAYFSQ